MRLFFFFFFFFDRAVEPGDQVEKMTANDVLPSIPREGPEQTRGPGLVPVGGRRRATHAAAAAASEREGGPSGRPPGRPGRPRGPSGLLRVWETPGEEDAVRTAGARGERVFRHAGPVAGEPAERIRRVSRRRSQDADCKTKTHRRDGDSVHVHPHEHTHGNHEQLSLVELKRSSSS
ncbi:hypothetical protein NHX12_007726 [Muraenolepis orangiensis]|uniref:Secreted protein n=1 Tax=Muraenolepis orangiensis TaxID=630683 RepID=A0A9Q0IBG7_9TELE|nr:hypothetical protein NHX12_007726 [Muraenolepis orangiensis]